MPSDLDTLQAAQRAFAVERDWEQFHTPKNLAAALSVEAAELLEHFQWLTEEQSRTLPEAKRVAVGEEIAVLPSGRRSTVTAIEVGGVPREHALAGDSVMIRLADDLDVGRGDLLARADESAPTLARGVEADLVWLDPAPLAPRRTYLLRHTTREVQARIEAIEWNLDVATLERVPAHELAMNDIARVRFRLAHPVFADAYATNRSTGAFVVIDEGSYGTVGAGMIVEADGPAAEA